MRTIRGRHVALAVAIALVASMAAAQAPPVFTTFDMHVPVPPAPLVGGAAVHLAYEVHFTNFSTRVTTLDAVDVIDGSSAPGAVPLLHLDAAALGRTIRRLGTPPDDRQPQVLPPGRTSVLFVWVVVPADRIPQSLKHRITFQIAGQRPSGANRAAGQPAAEGLDVEGLEVPVVRERPRVIAPPLEGPHWLAANGPGNGTDHRRAHLSLRGQARIAQRFAVDWVQLYEDGRTLRGDPRDNRSYRAFGAKVVAVADGTVVEAVDGIPENEPDPVRRAVPITPATLTGNHILLDIGGGAYAVYAHLQTGSVGVKAGERVRRGQVLARVGNTGNSSEPHLHFHVSDRRHALDAEGIPYVLDAFGLEAEPEVVTRALQPVGNSLGLAAAGLQAWRQRAPEARRNDLPLLNAIVTFQSQ